MLSSALSAPNLDALNKAMNMQKALIISNDAQRRKQARSTLEEYHSHYRCRSVSGKYALSTLDHEHWHLLITDLDMLEVTGLQLINVIATKGRDTNVLLRSTRCPTLDLSINAYADHKGVNVKIAHHPLLLLSDLGCLMARAKDESMQLQNTQRLQSLFAQHIVAYFQPIHCPTTGNLHGGEALMRWITAEESIWGPERVLPLLQTRESRLLLWHRMFDQSLAMLKSLPSNAQDICIGVNVTSDVASSVEWAENVAQQLSEEKINPARLLIEITEQEGDKFDSGLAGCISQLHLRGIKCAIDDFGTGFSSLQRLARIPFSLLKLDRQFITDARASVRTETILKSTIQLARDLGLQVVAEGVENDEDLTRIKRLGCDFVQGYYYSKPVSAAEFLVYADLFGRDAA